MTTAWRLAGTALLAAGGCGGGETSPVTTRVRPGLEVLVEDSAHLVTGRTVALLSNQAGVDRQGRHGVDVLRDHGVNLVAIFSPEHGFRGMAAPGEEVASTVDSTTGLPIYSLYGSEAAANLARVADADVMLIDLQDVGARYFTWLHLAVDVMRAAGAAGVPVVVLDRPNPIGEAVQGNVLDPAFQSPVGRLALPMRHGMTFGELVRLARHDLRIDVDLRVVPVTGWPRDLPLDETGLPFRPPSPNLRSMEALYHYPGLCLFEGTALSVGRGTDEPFTRIGAPWLDTTRVLARVRAAALPGVRFQGVTFLPRNPGDGKLADTLSMGIQLQTTDRIRYDPTRTAVHLLEAIVAIHGEQIGFIPAHFDRLAGTDQLRLSLVRGVPAVEIVSAWPGARDAFRRHRVEVLGNAPGAGR